MKFSFKIGVYLLPAMRCALPIVGSLGVLVSKMMIDKLIGRMDLLSLPGPGTAVYLELSAHAQAARLDAQERDPRRI